MHIVHVIDSLNIGGAERMLVELANQAARDGHRVTACVTRTEIPLAERLDPRVELMVLGRRRRTEARPVVKFARWVRQTNPDVLHAHGRSSFSLCAALKSLRLIDTPLLLHDHYGVELDPSVPRWFRFARRYCDAYVGVYASHREWAARAGLPSSATHVIGNAVSVEALLTMPVTSLATNGRMSLIAIGGIRREKAIDTLLDALARIDRDVALFVIGGDADPVYATACRERARRPDLSNRVTFLGARGDALGLAINATLAVHSSRAESGPLVLAEYAVLGVPFVSTRVGGIARALDDAGIGRFVEPDDAVGLAAAIESMLALDAGARSAIARAHAVKAHEMFDVSSVMPRWYSTYSEVRR